MLIKRNVDLFPPLREKGRVSIGILDKIIEQGREKMSLKTYRPKIADKSYSDFYSSNYGAKIEN